MVATASHSRYVSIPSHPPTPSASSSTSSPIAYPHDQPYPLSSEKSTPRAQRPVLPSHHSFTGGRRSSWRDAAAVLLRKGRTVMLVTVCLVLGWWVVSRHELDTGRVKEVLGKVTHPLTPAPTNIEADSTLQAAVEPATPAPYRLEDDMVLITKVGSATVLKRLLIHLAEQPHSNVYAPHRLYVSDYPLVLGNITFYDALANVSSTLASIDEFSALRGELRALMESNQDLDLMSDKDGGWKLDKYKFLPMMGEAYRRFPNKKWYVMVEADTFVFWNELVKWLSTLDADRQYMLGRAMFCDFDDRKSTPFMHGGSGFVLSRAVMEASYGQDPEFEHHHDNLTQHAAFGDALLTKALYDTPGVNLSDLSPESGERFNTDTPRSIKFTDGLWCRPVLTFHHVTPTDTAHLYDFQRRLEPLLDANDTVRWCDVWDEFIPLFLRKALRESAAHDPEIPLPAGEPMPGEVGVVGWQAFEDDDTTTTVGTKNALDCQAQCRSHATCMMWEFREKDAMGHCRLADDFLRIGVTKPRTNDGLTTGWMGRRVDEWRNNLSCSGRTGLNDYAKDGWRHEKKVEAVTEAEELDGSEAEVKAGKVGKVLESVAQKHEQKTPSKGQQQKKVSDKPQEKQHKEESHTAQQHTDKQ